MHEFINSSSVAMITFGLALIYYSRQQAAAERKLRILLGIFSIMTSVIWLPAPNDIMNKFEGQSWIVASLASFSAFLWIAVIVVIITGLRQEGVKNKMF